MIIRQVHSKKHGTVDVILDEVGVKLFDSRIWGVDFRAGKPAYLKANNPISGGNIYFHRTIMNAPKGSEIDHINGNKLDNRLSNLRFCSRSENLRNRRSYSKSSKYKGIVLSKNSVDKWSVKFTFEKQVFYTMSIYTEEEAARLYDRMIKLLHGKFAQLNFPEENK